MLGKKFCPRCESEDVEMVAGGLIGMWICTKCGFSGSIFPEKPIVGLKQEGLDKENIKKKKGAKR